MRDGSPSLGISLTEKIRADILSARFRPGTKLTVKMLSELYESGASPVREALNHMASEGIVTRIDRRGFFVSEVSAEEFHDILWNRELMEGEALRRSMDLGGADWEERVIITHYRLSSLCSKVERGGTTVQNKDWEVAHQTFHMALISACGSNILLDTCERLLKLNHRYRVIAGQIAQKNRDVASEHTEIKDLVLARRKDEAVQALHRHYAATGEYIFGVI